MYKLYRAYSFMEHANQFVFFRYKGVHETVSAVLKSFTNEIILDGTIIEVVFAVMCHSGLFTTGCVSNEGVYLIIVVD